MLHALLFALVQSPSAPTSPAAIDVPVRYVAGRVIAQPRTAHGQTLNLWVDTGGGGFDGMYLLSDAVAKRLHLQTDKIPLGKQSVEVADLPTFAPGAGIPAPAGKYAKALIVSGKGLEGPGDPMRYDGMLGAAYLPGNFKTHQRIWTFDYPGQRLTLQAANWRAPAGAHSTPLHFPVDAKGHFKTGFPRIVVHIDGKPLSMLLDVGATGYPTPAAVAVEGGTAKVRATGFITTSQLERWHKAHPKWRVVEDADRMLIKNKPMRAIEVPSVEIAGWRTGPVWFTERPDSNFHDFMSSMMDKQIEGSVGGNLFDHFVMTVDYAHEKAWFRCVNGCRPAPGKP